MKSLISVMCAIKQCAQHFENRGSPSGLVGQEMKWSVKFGLVGQEMKWSVKKKQFLFL